LKLRLSFVAVFFYEENIMQEMGTHLFMVGIKGTGMSSLALLLQHWGFSVCGCDTPEVFSSDAVLRDAGITVYEGFDASLLPAGTNEVIFSSAYSESLPILQEARNRSIPLCSYPQYLAHLSKQQDSYAVAGTHGKTTTCSVATHLLKHACEGCFPFYSIFGAPQKDMAGGKECALFEACEYQDHFHSYKLRGVLITSVEYDHPDYFSSKEHVMRSFEILVDNLQGGGFLIYCSDDPGASAIGSYAKETRPDLSILSYGFASDGPFRIVKGAGDTYRLALLRDLPFSVTSKAKALVDDHVGALVLSLAMLLDRSEPRLYRAGKGLITDEVLPTLASIFLPHLASYQGCKGRTEELFRDGEVIYLDDYAHHPSEIKTSLEEIRLRYPGYPLLVIFSAHTASRTLALLKEFAEVLAQSDQLILQSTYASARNDGSNTDDPALILFSLLRKSIGDGVAYAPSDEAAMEIAAAWLQERWLCITMGAGNNRYLGPKIAERRRSHQ
jgi:UDP-N-acetylmuramate--alanine ligase